MTQQTIKRELFQLPQRPEDKLIAEEIKRKIGVYKAIHRKDTLLQALAEIVEAGEKVLEAKK
jgi:hypothetical protein